jgi:hypothetical protein
VPLWRPTVGPVFERQFDVLDEADQDEVQRIINLLCIDPTADNEFKFILQIPDGGAVWYYDNGDNLWLSYKITGNDEFHLLSCARRKPPPHWGRRL